MSLGTSSVRTHTHKVGTCPHGMPLGACPICNGISGGNSTSRRDTPRNVGEMTYNQCAAIGAMLKAQKHAKAQAQAAQQSHLQALADFNKNLNATHARLVDLAVFISNSMPPVIAKPINFVINNIVLRVVNFVQNLPNFTANIIQKFVDISDKLAAIYGELQTAINEKISKFTGNLRKKLKSLFFIFGSQETDDEDKKIDEAKRTFELKTFIHKLYKKLKGQDEKEIKKDEY